MEKDQLSIINKSACDAIKQLVHDIRSPLGSLLMYVELSGQVPKEGQDFMLRLLGRISGVLNTSIQKYSDNQHNINLECNESVIASEVILAIIAEKSVEYHDKPVQFEHHFTQEGELASIKINQSDLERMISNLINNAVEACDGIDGVVGINLSKIDNHVRIAITDNGKGIPPEVAQKIGDNQMVTYGKKDGQGFGFKHIRETLANCSGELLIESEQSRPTTITLTFPQA